MNKSKSVFVAVLMAAMLALITVGCYLLKYRAWIVIAALFAVYGFLSATRGFAGWLLKEPPLLPPEQALTEVNGRQRTLTDELWKPDSSFTESYDQILEEFKSEKPSGGG